MEKIQYKVLLDKLPYAVFMCTEDCVVRYFNEAFVKVFEPTSTEDLIGSVINCGDNTFVECGKGEHCKICDIRKAFTDAITGNSPTFAKRIIKKIIVNGKVKNIAFNLTVKPIDRKHYMAVVENTFEFELYHQLLAAKNIQQNMLPLGDSVCGKNYAYMYVPLGEIGGDLLDVFELDGRAYGFVADVSGKGIGAAMLSSFIKAAFDKNEHSPAGALIKINQKYKDLKMDEREYITMLAMSIDDENQRIIYSAAGHNVPLLIKKQSVIKELATHSPPVSNWFDFFSYLDLKESYEKGDILALITDGITETKRNDGVRFGLDRVKEVLLNSKNAQEFIQKINEAVRAFAADIVDDMTALAFDL